MKKNKNITLLILVFLLTILLSSCGLNEVTNQKSSQVDNETPQSTQNESDREISEIESEEESSNSNFNTEESMEAIVETYPITGLALLDFCRFSFDENTTLLSDMVAVLGEPSGYHADFEPYFTLYDGTTITFAVNEEGYISNPYLTDALNRKFEYFHSPEATYEFLNTDEIDRIKNGEYMPDHYSHPMSYGYTYYDRFLSISDFADHSGSSSQIGMPSGSAGSGMPWFYYQLADSSYYSYMQGVIVDPDSDIDFGNTRIMITDYIDRSFFYTIV